MLLLHQDFRTRFGRVLPYVCARFEPRPNPDPDPGPMPPEPDPFPPPQPPLPPPEPSPVPPTRPPIPQLNRRAMRKQSSGFQGCLERIGA